MSFLFLFAGTLEQVLSQLPQKTLSLDLVLGIAREQSDTWKNFESQAERADAFNLMALAPHDVKILSQGQHLDSRPGAFGPFQTLKNIQSLGKIEILSQTMTGTTLKASAESTLSEIENMLGKPPSTFNFLYESKASLSVEQDLLKNAFGYSARLNYQSTLEQRESFLSALADGKEQFLQNLATVYHQAVHTQHQIEASLSHLGRRETLLRIGQKKEKRGDGERSDVLQMESAVLQAKVDFEKQSAALKEIWRTLVLTLKLNNSWLAFDPLKIPLEVTPRTQDILLAKNICSSNAPLKTYKLEQLGHDMQAKFLKMKQAHHQFFPTLKAYGSYGLNGISGSNKSDGDHTLGTSIEKIGKGEHPTWAIGIKFEIPILHFQERAQALQAFSEHTSSEIAFLMEQTQSRLTWLNQCALLESLEIQRQHITQALSKNKERAQMDAKRFELGSINALAAISSADETTRTETMLRVAEFQLGKVSWDVLRNSKSILPLVETFRPQAQQFIAKKVVSNESTH